MGKSKKIFLKTPEQIAIIRTGGKYLTELLYELHAKAIAGTSLQSLEAYAVQFFRKYDLKSAFQGYQGYPANLCLSVNHGLVHCVPNEYILRDGDLLKIDCGVVYQGLITDAAIAKVIGGKNKNPTGHALMETTKVGLDTMIQMIKPGLSLYNFGCAMEDFFKNKEYSIIRSLTGHGIGLQVHEAPSVFNWGNPLMKNTYFKSGMVLAIEPITAERSTDYIEDVHNDRNLYTKEGDLGCHREYTITVHDTGIEVLAGIQEHLR